MSRESELQILQDMKNEIVEIYDLSERCKKMSDECDALSDEINSPAAYSFNELPANNEESLKKEFNEKYREKQLSGGKLRYVFPIINTIIVLLMSVIILADFNAGTGILISPEQVKTVCEFEQNITLITVLQIFAAFFMIYIPFRLAKRGISL